MQDVGHAHALVKQMNGAVSRSAERRPYRFITFSTAMLIACAAVLIDGSGTGA
jgi:hypothetical protein